MLVGSPEGGHARQFHLAYSAWGGGGVGPEPHTRHLTWIPPKSIIVVVAAVAVPVAVVVSFKKLVHWL